MKWQQRVRVATGLSCWQIMLHLLVVAVLVMGWMSGALVRVGLGLCVLYSVTLLAMLFLQRHHDILYNRLLHLSLQCHLLLKFYFLVFHVLPLHL